MFPVCGGGARVPFVAAGSPALPFSTCQNRANLVTR